MDISRLKSLRAGNRAAVTKVFNKLEDAIVDTPLDPEEICTLLEAVEKKKKTLANIDEQILNTVDSEGITDEIIETDEYYLELRKVSDCRSKYDCRICHRKHHTSICKKNTTHQSEDKDNTETSMLYTSASQETSTVLLKTAVAQTKTTVQLKANNGEIIPIKVLIVPTIASPLQSQSRKITQGLHYLHGLSLAHPVTDAESFELTLLIGADFYWNIVQDKVIRGNGPTAVSSKLGYLLSGPVPVKNNNQSTSMMNVLISHKQETCDLEKFWKLESLGIDEKEVDTQLIDVMETFAESSITKQNGKYVSKLPWKENCPEFTNKQRDRQKKNRKCNTSYFKRQEMFRMYGDIISDQERRGFIEKENDDIPLTKREVLRQSSRIFDPLGLISPVTVTSKLFMQRLWKEKLNWDELLPCTLKEEWKSIAMEIEEATKTEISRQITPEYDAQEETELHIFTDASQQAYGACAYLVKGNTSSLIITKNRVAPVKTITLPRLELMGALIGARLANYLVGFIDTHKTYFWSDSQIVLSWISSTKNVTYICI
ncbi:Hypothetical predicted protein [Mytilus galloprovincialis]|uniref:Peptidase aspartic putative domain-containing protein n=1 Tax=Mytilus galloprovincialis TaxID=29158 RepID=A0A8B6ECK5_MYTGA|nr:Hypothetical predicted protein [Mytilus galloprovincialis]